MPIDTSHDVTQLLLAWNDGDQTALERLIPSVHAELRRIARRHMRNERAEHTLQASALINEAYLRLINAQQVHWQNRAHFFAIASQLMRRILVDFARSHNYKKRGGGLAVVCDESRGSLSSLWRKPGTSTPTALLALLAG